jgi:hypothetical protein
MQCNISPLYAISKIGPQKITFSRRANHIRFVVKFCLAVGAVSFAGLAVSRERAVQTVDPLTVAIDASDAIRFAALFNDTDGNPTAQKIQKHYLDGSGRGVAIFSPYRIHDADNLAAAVAKNTASYRYAIATCLPVLDRLSGELRAIYLAYRGLLPSRALPAVYIVFGAGNSGGTAAKDAQVIGLEVMCSPGTSADQFRSKMRSILAHEPVHSWQSDSDTIIRTNPLLADAMAEGVADFLATLVTGEIPNPERAKWAEPRELELWNEFSRDCDIVRLGTATDGTRTLAAEAAYKRWIANYRQAPEGWPDEAGYWIGMRIAQTYFAKSLNKQLAIEHLISMRDPSSILSASGYSGQ